MRYDFISYYLKNNTVPGSIVLDIGCGDKVYKNDVQGKYEGLDLAESTYLVEPPELVGRIEDIQLEGEKYNLIFGVGSFMYMSDLVSIFQKCYKALAPGGKLVIFDYQRSIINKAPIADNDKKNLGSAKNLTKLMLSSGYASVKDLSFLSHDQNFLINNSLQFSLRSLLGLLARYSLTLVRKGTWLILEAQK